MWLGSSGHGTRTRAGWLLLVATSVEGQNIEMSFYDPNSAKKQLCYWQSNYSQTGYVGLAHGVGMQDTTTPKHGLRLSMHTGTFEANGHWAVYGYKI